MSPAPTQLKNRGTFNFCGTFLCYSKNYESVFFFPQSIKTEKLKDLTSCSFIICTTEFKIKIKMSFIVPRHGKICLALFNYAAATHRQKRHSPTMAMINTTLPGSSHTDKHVYNIRYSQILHEYICSKRYR